MTSLALTGLPRAPGRTLIRIFTLAAAVALLGAMLLFIGHSLQTMTGGAVRSVPIDWQGPVGSYSAALRATRGVARLPGVLEAAPVATAPFKGIEHRAAAGRVRAGAGAILAIPPGYSNHIHTFRMLRGSLAPSGVVLDQQLAATLQVQPGDTVRLSVGRGAPPVRLRVSGVALVQVLGSQKYAVRVQLDPTSLANRGIGAGGRGTPLTGLTGGNGSTRP